MTRQAIAVEENLEFPTDLDLELCRRLGERTSNDPSYWDFRHRTKRDGLHGITQYPAMMIPGVQGDLFDVLSEINDRPPLVLDPFVGSGTTLVEAMRRGLSFTGQDINPLAVLISKAKIGPFDLRKLRRAFAATCRSARRYRRGAEVNFEGLKKWFDPGAAQDLSRLRRAIGNVADLWVRRVLWVALAETVRLSSNSRTSTYKLHIRSADDIAEREIDVNGTFAGVGEEVIRGFEEELLKLRAAGLVSGTHFQARLHIGLGDSAHSLAGQDRYDLLMTSPPYGDNVSTVPYGQYSFLPLQWIDMEDISDAADSSYLTTTHEIDTRSLGGRRKKAVELASSTTSESPALTRCLDQLLDEPRDRANRVAAFATDLRRCLDTVMPRIAADGYMAWTVGNRRVGGRPVPLDEILQELLQARGCVRVADLSRRIPNKRMATRNSISATMRQERILIFRKRAPS